MQRPHPAAFDRSANHGKAWKRPASSWFGSARHSSTYTVGRTRSQGGTFHGHLSGRENAAFIARVYGAGLKPTIRFVEEFAELDEYFDMPVNTYSAGMRARLAFGACLAIDFDVYLIDEVTEIGDERFRRKCAAVFRERMRRADIILATHNLHTVRRYCDRGAVLAGGRLRLFDDLAGAVEGYRRLVAEPAECDCAD